MLRSLLALVLLCAACAAEGGTADFGSAPTPAPPVDIDRLCVTEGLTRCDGLSLQVCTDGEWRTSELCVRPTPICDPDRGCVACNPDRVYCVEDELYRCDEAGTGLDFEQQCPPEETCLAGACRDACELASTRQSYLGCRFTAVATANLVSEVFDEDFAVVIGNPEENDEARVVVSRDGTTVASLRVPPGRSGALTLPVVPALKTYDGTARSVAGAYLVESDQPVAAYQWNPLNYFLDVRIDGVPERVFSYSNDASLLLPDHALGTEYIVSTWPTWGIGDPPDAVSWLPGFIAVAAVEDGTQVDVRVAAYTLGGAVSPAEPGETVRVTLDRGDVLQLFSRTHDGTPTSETCGRIAGLAGSAEGSPVCLDVAGGDLTGSRVTASRDVAVFTGHVCTFMPLDAWACDHLEEMVVPAAALGRRVLMSAPRHPRSGTARAVYRVLSAAENNVLAFTPNDVHPSVVLDEGEFLEFASDRDFLVAGSSSLVVTQTLVGQFELGSERGDPALGTGVPLNQWRDRYDILAPDSYETNHLNVVAERSAAIYLDGERIAAWDEIDGTDYHVARLTLTDGSHHIRSLEGVPFGITSYGYGSFTSYLTPGGMNFIR